MCTVIYTYMGFALQMSNYSSMEGVLYCKTHAEQLFKESGSFTKKSQSGNKILKFFLISYIYPVSQIIITRNLIMHCFWG